MSELIAGKRPRDGGILRAAGKATALELGLDRTLEAYRKELTAYCYRMLGSGDEAQDAVQDTLFRAWRSYSDFEGRSALRSWLYKIATNVCMTMLDGRQRRALPTDLQASSSKVAPLGPRMPENIWVQPIPDRITIDASGDPADVVVARENVRLAFIAALQHLPPRQRSVLILRDVLRWQATEVADLLDVSVISVNGLLRRARKTLASRGEAATTGRSSRSPLDQALLVRYVAAFERFDIEALVSLLRDDAIFSMPPYGLWLQGASMVGNWLVANPCSNARLVPVEANGAPGYAVYRQPSSGADFEAYGIQVLVLCGPLIGAVHSYLDPGLFPMFELPHVLARR